MMKKVLWIVGIGALGTATFLYFKRQLDLALSYDYDVDDIRFVSLSKEQAELQAEIRLTNKSAFSVEVIEYDLQLFYADVDIARTFSTESFRINPDSFSKVKVNGTIDFDKSKDILLPLASAIVGRKPIKISVAGYVKVKFMGIPYTIRFEREEFEYSADLLQEYGWDDDLEKLKDKLPFLRKL